jgi:hypothetical protein
VALSPYGGCWRSGGAAACGDPAPATCPDPSLPLVRAAAGERLTFHLSVTPTRVLLSWGDGAREESLAGGRVVTWRARPPSGALVIRAEVAGRGDLADAACLSLSSASP